MPKLKTKHLLSHAIEHCHERARDRMLPGLTDQRFIYFVQCNEFVKVGVATNVQYRLSMMQTGNHYQLKLIKVMESADAEQDEESIHAALEKYRVRGEWFKLPPEVLELVLRPRTPIPLSSPSLPLRVT